MVHSTDEPRQTEDDRSDSSSDRVTRRDGHLSVALVEEQEETNVIEGPEVIDAAGLMIVAQESFESVVRLAKWLGLKTDNVPHVQLAREVYYECKCRQ